MDDICGKFTIDENEVREWNKYISEELAILSSGNIKILTSNRYQVFQDHRFKMLKVFSKNICDLSFGSNCTSVWEKEKIALKYLPQDIFEKIKLHIGQMDYFPLMCQQYNSRPITDPLKFFNNPFDVLEEEISAMREEDKLKYCALLVCVLLNGSIRKADMKYEKCLRVGIYEDGYDFIDETTADETEIYGIHSKFSRNELQNIFDICELNRETPTNLIFRQYDCLLNTYMKKIGHNYNCIHDKVFELLCNYFGKHLQREVIVYSDSKVIRDHTHLLSMNEEHDSVAILVETDNETLYFSRIIRDICQGRIYDVFCNNQMKFRIFRLKFINFLQANPELNLNKLFYTKDKSGDEGTDPVTSLYIVCCKGYQDLAEYILAKTDNFFDRNYHPMNAAASVGHCHLLELMISKGAEVNHRDDSGHTPMTMACLSKHVTAVKLLIQNGADLNKRTNKGPTPLMWVCTSSDKTMVELLLYHGADIDKPDYEGKTPVMWSRKCAENKMFDFLIYKGADLNKGDNNAWTPLMWACFYGLTNIVNTLILNRADINQVNDFGWTSFMIACSSGKEDIVKFLIGKGVEINMREKLGRTALMLACAERQENVVKILIENKANIDCQDKYGVTPLIDLCSKGHVLLVDILLKNLADCNKADNEGWTPLMVSCFSNNYRLINSLVEHGADLDKTNIHGETALVIVCMGVIKRQIAFCTDTGIYKHYVNFDKLDHRNNEVALTIIKCLLSNGANINKPDYQGSSALMWACKNNQIEKTSYLIEKGANVNHTSSNGKSILQMALQEGRYDIIKLLFNDDFNEFTELMNAIKHNDIETIEFISEHYFKMHKNKNSSCQRNITEKWTDWINGIDSEGDTPLLLSCRNRNIDIVECLIKKGADVNISSCNGLTALRVACIHKEPKLVQLLIKAGANVYSELVYAFKRQDNSTVDLLFYSIPNINEMLYKSCKFKEIGLAYFLIERGADIVQGIEEIDQGKEDISNIIWLSECIEPSQALLLACRNNSISIITALLTLGANVNICSKNRKTPLMFASHMSSIKIVKLLLRKGAWVNAIDINGWDPLRWALFGVKMKNVDHLIRKGASIETTFNSVMRDANPSLLYPLMQKGRNSSRFLSIACEYSDINIVQILLFNGAKVNYLDREKKTPLMKACKVGNKDIISLLVKHGSCVNDDLFKAVKLGDNNLAKRLIEAGGSLNKVFFYSCLENNKQVQHALIKLGLDINNVLRLACCEHNLWAVKQILNFEFDINFSDEKGFTILMTACRYSNDEIFKVLLKVGKANIFKSLKSAYVAEGSQFCKMLIGKCRNEDLSETLFQASRMGHFEIMQLLIEKNVDINQHDEAGDSPLMIACTNEYQLYAELLINNGADTLEAFKWAFRHNDVNSTRFLLECGADVNRRDPIEWSPLTWICFIRQENITNNRCLSSEQESIINLLILNGADVNYALQNVCEMQFDIDKESSIELLIDKGADINHTDKNGRKLLKLLKRDGNNECVKLLQLYGRKKKKCIVM